MPAALHGIEASLLASDSLRKLRSSVCRVVWSRRQLMADVGAVLSLLDGPTGCDPAFCVVWMRFRLLRRYLALWPAEVGRVYRLLAMVGEGCPGHGPNHLLSDSAAEIGFHWDLAALAWSRPRLPLLSNLAGPLQHFKDAILDAWRNKVTADLCGRKGFRGGPLLVIHRSLQLFNSSHVRERDTARGQVVPCQFCGAPDSGGHLFWDCPFPPLVETRENPEFHDLMRMDKSHWPRCLLWHGWLPMLSGVNGASPWAVLVLMRVLFARLRLHLVATLLVSVLSGVFLLVMMRLKLPFWSRITPMSGGRDRIWPNLIWPFLFGRIWPNRIWPIPYLAKVNWPHLAILFEDRIWPDRIWPILLVGA